MQFSLVLVTIAIASSYTYATPSIISFKAYLQAPDELEIPTETERETSTTELELQTTNHGEMSAIEAAIDHNIQPDTELEIRTTSEPEIPYMNNPKCSNEKSCFSKLPIELARLISTYLPHSSMLSYIQFSKTLRDLSADQEAQIRITEMVLRCSQTIGSINISNFRVGNHRFEIRFYGRDLDQIEIIFDEEYRDEKYAGIKHWEYGLRRQWTDILQQVNSKLSPDVSGLLFSQLERCRLEYLPDHPDRTEAYAICAIRIAYTSSSSRHFGTKLHATFNAFVPADPDVILLQIFLSISCLTLSFSRSNASSYLYSHLMTVMRLL